MDLMLQPPSNKRRWNVKTLFVGIVLIVIVGVLIISFVVAYKLTHLADNTEHFFNLGSERYPSEDVSFKSSDGRRILKGAYFPSPSNSQRTLIIVHGYGSNRWVKGRTEKLVESFQKSYNILAFDLGGQGESEGDMITLGQNEQKDLEGALSFIKSKGPAGKKIAVLGFSMGAATSLITASHDDRIDAVIADSAFRNAKDYLNEGLPYFTHLPAFPFNGIILGILEHAYGVHLSQLSPIDDVSHLKTKPVFLIHTKADQQIPYQNSQLIFEALSDNLNAKLWTPADGDHMDAINVYTNEYMVNVSQFLNTALGDYSIREWKAP